MTAQVDLWVWRHPRAIGAAGRCIGRTDLAVDRRKAKRLAGRIRATARRHGLPREILTSPLRRCADVGRILRNWGWTHRIDTDLLELDFGRWDGLHWTQIAREDVERWEADFVHHAPGGGESQADLRARIARFARRWTKAEAAQATIVLAISHAGWISAAAANVDCVDPALWPAPMRVMGCRRIAVAAG